MTPDNVHLPYWALPRSEIEVSGSRVILDREGTEIAYVPFDEDADFIEKACNRHALLIRLFDAVTTHMHGQTADSWSAVVNAWEECEYE